MRTTIVIDDDLFREAKQRAARTGTSLSQVVSVALRETLRERPPAPAARFRMPTFGGPGRVTHEPADLAQALEEEDRMRVD